MVNHPNRSKSTSKFPLDWHRECLSNRRKSLARQQEQLDRLKAEVQKSVVETEFYANQIEEAERRGMTDFDKDRLLIKKPAPASRSSLEGR